ncbi:hypothetical protein ACJRO7_026082 [Eucalyptus globulus]|uniref:Uncharacterized protein n=1 Tax=Eucalyptus globulus TaxID=34317 RepID=A0ABD3KB53_EUCGL
MTIKNDPSNRCWSDPTEDAPTTSERPKQTNPTDPTDRIRSRYLEFPTGNAVGDPELRRITAKNATVRCRRVNGETMRPGREKLCGCEGFDRNLWESQGIWLNYGRVDLLLFILDTMYKASAPPKFVNHVPLLDFHLFAY